MATQLHAAAQRFDLGEVTRLLAQGVDVNALDAQGRTALDIVSAIGDPSFSPYEMGEISDVEAAICAAGGKRAREL